MARQGGVPLHLLVGIPIGWFLLEPSMTVPETVAPNGLVVRGTYF